MASMVLSACNTRPHATDLTPEKCLSQNSLNPERRLYQIIGAFKHFWLAIFLICLGMPCAGWSLHQGKWLMSGKLCSQLGCPRS